MARVPTVTIKGENGPVVINESDYDPETQELYAASSGAAGDTPAQGEKVIDPSGLKVDELKAELEAREIEIPEGAKKADLVEILTKALTGEAVAGKAE